MLTNKNQPTNLKYLHTLNKIKQMLKSKNSTTGNQNSLCFTR